jgi:hypothetical protein
VQCARAGSGLQANWAGSLLTEGFPVHHPESRHRWCHLQMTAETLEAGAVHQPIVDQAKVFVQRLVAGIANVEALAPSTFFARNVDPHPIGYGFGLRALAVGVESVGPVVGLGATANGDRFWACASKACRALSVSR